MSNDKLKLFETNVLLKYQIYNGLFLGLPFQDVDQAGAQLTIFSKVCEEGLALGRNPSQIMLQYFDNLDIPFENKVKLLFKFLQFIERQIVLFDALEDTSFNQLNNIDCINANSSIQQIAKHDNISSTQLSKYKVRIVLTAHPTQFYPNTILGIIADMEKSIANNDLQELRSLFLQMGLSRFNNKIAPTPLGEARSLMWYLEHVFYKVFPIIQSKISTDLVNLELGFWPGGDRDGNPFVTSSVTLDVAKLLKKRIICLYLKDLHLLKRKLTFDGILDKLLLIIDKLSHNKYINVKILLNDLQDVRHTLQNNYQGLFIDKLDSFILKVQMFQFYFAKIDIRQNSAIHQQVVHHLFAHNKISYKYSSLNKDGKIQLLTQHMQDDKLDHTTEPMVNEVLDSIASSYVVRGQNGASAIERYIISNSTSAVNILEVLFLMSVISNSLPDKLKKLPKLEIVPLFETITDLNNATQIMQELYENELYIQQLKQHENKQTIMLGFSDGTKDGGYLMANWSIYLAKEQLSSQAQQYGINLVFFDGRGGAISRGGGNIAEFYSSDDLSVASNEIQLTIQGQSISSNFGTSDLATYNLEKIILSGLDKFTMHQPIVLDNDEKNLINELANISYQAYRKLYTSDLFVEYLEECTPLPYLMHVNVGSRPAKRSSSNKLNLSDLRAIPFVGAWSQMRQNILGFYGLGFAINQLITKDKNYLAKIQALYQKSLFFKTLMHNSMQSLAQSNFLISAYLADDIKFGGFWLKLKNEADLAHKMFLQISQQESLLMMDDVKIASIRQREKIIAPLLVIQQFALLQLRSDEIMANQHDILVAVIKKSLAANINSGRNST